MDNQKEFCFFFNRWNVRKSPYKMQGSKQHFNNPDKSKFLSPGCWRVKMILIMSAAKFEFWPAKKYNKS